VRPAWSEVSTITVIAATISRVLWVVLFKVSAVYIHMPRFIVFGVDSSLHGTVVYMSPDGYQLKSIIYSGRCVRVSEMSVVVLEGVSKRFSRTQALLGVSMELDRGSTLLLLGPNGSGKSTLLRILCGVLRPDEGCVRVRGLDPWFEGSRLWRFVACMCEGVSLSPEVSCFDVLEELVSRRGVDAGFVDWVADVLGVKSFWRRPFYCYSHGMKKRCLLALYFGADAEILVLDEPFEGLDRSGIEAVNRLVEYRARRGLTTIVASHIPALRPDIVTHIAVLRNGRLIAFGRVDEVAERFGALYTCVPREEGLEIAKRLGLRGVILDHEICFEGSIPGVEGCRRVDLSKLFSRALSEPAYP